jgi:hypothetical protein
MVINKLAWYKNKADQVRNRLCLVFIPVFKVKIHQPDAAKLVVIPSGWGGAGRAKEMRSESPVLKTLIVDTAL